jgi:cytosine/adenosine deaminase-related metal-dependent hydrolase
MSNSLFFSKDQNGQSLLTQGARVLGFGPEAKAENGLELDCTGAVIKTGRVNAHTHVYSGLAPFGIPAPEPEPENFVQILERLWWRLDRALDRDSFRASARYYAAESLLRGCTAIIDHHESPNLIEGSLDILADACQELGLRAVICFGATERNFGREEARRGLAECERFIRSNTRPLVKGVVALHASFTVSDETIKEAGDLCRELGTIMHVHMAEDGADVVDAKQRGYEGPLERLEALDALPKGSILAHGVFLTEAQVRRVGERGCWMVHNPRSNHGNKVGYSRYLGASELVGLGTDGYPSDLAEEREVLYRLGAEHGESREVLERRTRGGYAMLEGFFEGPFAPLAEGSVADVVAMDMVDGSPRARHACVDGRLVVQDGKLLTADHPAIVAEAKEQSVRLFEKMRAMPSAVGVEE